MPTDIAEFLSKRGGAPPAKPPLETPLAPPEEPGTDIAAFLAARPKPPSLKDKVVKAAAPAAAKVKEAVGWEGHGLMAGVADATRQIHSALDQLREDINEPDTESMPLHGLKTAWTALNTLWAPASAGLDVAVTQPIQMLQQRIGDFLEQYASEDEYDAQARREGQRGQQFPKGVDWKIHKADIQRTVAQLQDQTSAAVQALPVLLGASEKVPTSERAGAMARTALKDLKEAVAPPEPKLVPITVSLDKTVGFGKAAKAVGEELNKLQPGTTFTSHAVIDKILPHTEGYAKAFMEKLKEHIAPDIPVTFKNQAGSSPLSVGVHFPNSRAIEIKLGEPDIIQTTVHEMVHGATVNMLDTLIEADLKRAEAAKGRMLTNEETLGVVHRPSSPILKELDQIIQEARLRAQKAGKNFQAERDLYGIKKGEMAFGRTLGESAHARMTPRYEFIAEVFSNPNFQEFLANSEKYASAGYKFKNMLNQLSQLVGKHFGMKGQELRLLSQGFSVGTRLIRMQAEEKAPSGRSIVEVVAQTRDGESITRGDIKQATEIRSERVAPAPPKVTDDQLYDAGFTEYEIREFRRKPNDAHTISQLSKVAEGYSYIEGRFRKIESGDVERYRGYAAKEAEKRKAMQVKLDEALADTDGGRRSQKLNSILGDDWQANTHGTQADAARQAFDRRYSSSARIAGRYERAYKKPVEQARLIDRKSVRDAQKSLQISVEQILRTFSPESLGRNAKLAAAAIASRITEQLQRETMWRHGSSTRLKFWRARPDFTTEFITKFEKGEDFSDPAMRDLARKYKAWGARISERDRKLGFDYEPRDNYLYHIFEDSEGVANYFSRKYGSKWGDPGFIKERTFDLYKEAVAAGFRPRFDNPEDIMLARQHASDIAEMHTGIMNDLASYGLATRKIVGGERLVKSMDAEGKMRFDVEKTEGNKQPPNTVRWRSPNGDVFWVDAQADAILQNAFKSKSLWEDKGLGGTVFRGMMSLKNALVPVRLALSFFHPLHVMGIDMAAGFTRGVTGLLSGTVPVHRALGEMLASGLGYRPLAELPLVRRLTNPPGWRVLQALRGKIPKELLTADDAHALETLIEMGIAPEMSTAYRTNVRQNFLNALTDAHASFRQGQVVGGTGDLMRATWHLPWAMISAMSKPIFEEWIPALKAASALKDAKNLLGRNPELVADDAARHLAMRKLGKSVENRYGEMNYSQLFWKRWMKDIAVMDTLSLGWQLGFLREYGGGAMELGQWAKSGDKLNRIRKGQLDRAIFVGAYTTLGAGVAGMMTWAMTGSPPESLLDYVSPRTGEQNADGTPQRVSTMFYSREFAALYKHIQNEGLVPGVSQLVLNKGSGLFGLMHEWATGVNGFGQEIRDPNSDAFKKLEQTLAYTLSDLEPISMQAIHNSISEKPVKGGVLSVLGFTPAPKYLTESKTEAAIKTAFRNYVAPKETPYEKAEYSKEYSQLREAYQSGSEKYGDLLDKMVESYNLSGQDQRRLIRGLNSDTTPSMRMWIRLGLYPQTQKEMLDKMTPEERDIYLPHASKKVRNTYEPPPE